MKFVGLVVLTLFSTTLTAQGNLAGNYLDYYGKRIELYSDSTFKYFDRPSWWEGTWTVNKDTIFLLAKLENNSVGRSPNPEKVVYQKGRLYRIKNGKLDTKKRKIVKNKPFELNDPLPFPSYKKIPSWFVKSEDY
ncbi:MAG: hypothetical protein HZB42_05100 [Sphingobacteriales bacterium]|nr:hypothetical protein [Sphingobacteriales bacterium]